MSDDYPTMDIVDHICYAIKNEGIDLSVLTELLSTFGETERLHIADAISGSPKSRDSSMRKLGYMYETIVGEEIPLQDNILTKTTYDSLFNPEIYYTSSIPKNISAKFKITDNSIGNITTICPIIRRTDNLDIHSAADYGQSISSIFGKVNKNIIDLACDRLALNETQHSFIYEKDTHDAKSRITKLKEVMLNMDLNKDYLTEEHLVELQNCIASKYKQDDAFRNYQNFIGGYIGSKPVVTYMPPKPQLLRGYMSEVHKLYTELISPDCGLDPVIAGSIVGCYFVLAHPFADGNGRISRFLMQNVWMRRGYNYKNMILPISEALSCSGSDSKNDYIKSLANITTPMMNRQDYHFVSITEDGQDFYVPEFKKCNLKAYAYPDLTAYCETVYDLVKEASSDYLPKTVIKTQIIETTKEKLRNEVSIGDKRLSKFVDLCLHNDGVLSNNKRRSFRDIPSAAIDRIQAVVLEEYSKFKELIGRDNEITSELIDEYSPCI